MAANPGVLARLEVCVCALRLSSCSHGFLRDHDLLLTDQVRAYTRSIDPVDCRRHSARIFAAAGEKLSTVNLGTPMSMMMAFVDPGSRGASVDH